MTIEKTDNDELNNIAGGYDAEKGPGYVFFCDNCGEFWTKWYDKEQNYCKGEHYKCPNCKQQDGRLAWRLKKYCNNKN